MMMGRVQTRTRPRAGRILGSPRRHAGHFPGVRFLLPDETGDPASRRQRVAGRVRSGRVLGDRAMRVLQAAPSPCLDLGGPGSTHRPRSRDRDAPRTRFAGGPPPWVAGRDLRGRHRHLPPMPDESFGGAVHGALPNDYSRGSDLIEKLEHATCHNLGVVKALADGRESLAARDRPRAHPPALPRRRHARPRCPLPDNLERSTNRPSNRELGAGPDRRCFRTARLDQQDGHRSRFPRGLGGRRTATPRRGTEGEETERKRPYVLLR